LRIHKYNADRFTKSQQNTKEEYCGKAQSKTIFTTMAHRRRYPHSVAGTAGNRADFEVDSRSGQAITKPPTGASHIRRFVLP
jgi:hypothetical protein